MGEKQGGSMIGKGSSIMESVYGSLSGLAFGLVSPLASQPFDTLKTKMQAEALLDDFGHEAEVLKTLRKATAAKDPAALQFALHEASHCRPPLQHPAVSDAQQLLAHVKQPAPCLLSRNHCPA